MIAGPLGGDPLRPRNDVVPSCRPRQKPGWIFNSPVRFRLGGGAAHATGGDSHRLWGSQSACPIKASGSGRQDLGAPWRCKTQSIWRPEVLPWGSALWRRVRRRAHPLCSLRPV